MTSFTNYIECKTIGDEFRTNLKISLNLFKVLQL